MVERDFTIRPIREGDFPQVRDIYELGLETGHASYETSGPTWDQFSQSKIMDTVMVAVENNDPDFILGWVSAAPISSRQVFHGVVEDSIYIHPRAKAEESAALCSTPLSPTAKATASGRSTPGSSRKTSVLRNCMN
ncbi:hypothetical protein KbCgl_09670 [Corynebacterium glutamicum]|nr:hypothetical protein KbCgl_09670 [Corynebacterium glutamicum]